MTRDDLLTLSQRLREYNHNPHHINPVSDAFHKLIVDAANALSAVAAVWGCLAIPDGWRIERRELDGSVCFIIGAPRMAGVRSNTSVWLSDSDPAHLLLWHLLAATPAQPAAQGEFGDAYQGAREDLAIWKRRALEAEARVRQQDQIIDQMGEDLNAINGPTFMGEPALPAAQDQGEVRSRERWTVMCGHWQDTTLAIHGERTGHIASGIDEDAAHAIVNAHNQGLPPIAAASTGQEVKP